MVTGPNTITTTRRIGATATANRSGVEIAHVFGSTSAKISTRKVISSVA